MPKFVLNPATKKDFNKIATYIRVSEDGRIKLVGCEPPKNIHDGGQMVVECEGEAILTKFVPGDFDYFEFE